MFLLFAVQKGGMCILLLFAPLKGCLPIVFSFAALESCSLENGERAKPP